MRQMSENSIANCIHYLIAQFLIATARLRKSRVCARLQYWYEELIVATQQYSHLQIFPSIHHQPAEPTQGKAEYEQDLKVELPTIDKYKQIQMKESQKYAIVNNNLQRVSPLRPDVSMFNVNTNQSYEVQSELSVGSSYGLHSRSIHLPRREEPPIEDGKLLVRYLMACIEIERMGRYSEKLKIARYNEQQVTRQLRTEHELLKVAMHSKGKEVSGLNEEVVVLSQKLRHFEQLLREKQRQLSHKDEQIRSTRLELTGMSLSHSRFEHNEKNKIKELQAELSMERNRYVDLLKKKEESDTQLRLIAQRETALETTASTNQRRLASLEEEASAFRNLKAKLEAEHKQSTSSNASLVREKQQLIARMEDFRSKADLADQFQKTLHIREAQISNLAKEAQTATGKAQALERELSTVQAQLRALRQSEGDNIRKQFASLENRLTALGNAEKESQGKGSQLHQLTKERDSLHAKVEQLLMELGKLERMLATRDSDCRGCSRLSSENSILSKKVGVLEQSLRQRQSEVLKLSARSTTTTTEKNGTKVSVKDLLLSAQQLKGSNERMSRLIDSTSEYELKTVVKSASQHRVLSHRQ